MARSATLYQTTADAPNEIPPSEDDEALAHVPNPPETAPGDDDLDPKGNDVSDVDMVLASGDMTAVREFLMASMDQERKALHKYVKLDERLSGKLRDARDAYLSAQSRTARLWKAATNGLAQV